MITIMGHKEKSVNIAGTEREDVCVLHLVLYLWLRYTVQYASFYNCTH